LDASPSRRLRLRGLFLLLSPLSAWAANYEGF
jgi:hypothetical protein